MLSKTGSFTFHIESYVCDFEGKATLPVIGNLILQAATIHAGERGFGYEAIVKDRVAWVLSRLSLEMYSYPGHDEGLTIETWIEDIGRFFTQRCFRFINGQRETTGYARTIWAAIDMTTRRPIDILAWRPDMSQYVDAERHCPVKKPEKIVPVAGQPVDRYVVRYSDIDINRHMNSVKYMEHAVNVFDLEMFVHYSIRRFEIVYLQEGTFGDKLDLYREAVSPNEYLIDTRKATGESVCRCRIVWELKAEKR
jgi:acyl-ACP thioesterase